MQISEKGFNFLLDRVYFTGDDGDQNFLVFTPMLSSLTMDSNEKVTKWILTAISSKKIKPFETNLKLIMFDLANGRVILKFNNSVLVHRGYFSLHSSFFLNLHIAYELNNWPINPSNNFLLKIVCLLQSS